MGFLEKYWPSIVGTVVVGTAGWMFFPESDETPDVVGSGILAGPDIKEVRTAALPKERDLLADTPRRNSGKQEVSAKPSDEGFELREIKTAVLVEGEQKFKTVTGKDPEVKRALSRVKIELMQTADCPHCESARKFLSQNGLNFTVLDMKRNRVEKRARELTGGKSVPILILDGRATVGFSKGKYESALAAAAKKRMGS